MFYYEYIYLYICITKQLDMINKIIKTLFPEKSKWIDVGMYDSEGHYKLIQMRYRLDNNKKEFRTTSMGLVNDKLSKLGLFEKAQSFNA